MDRVKVDNKTESFLEQDIQNILKLVIQETNNKDSLWDLNQLKVVKGELVKIMTGLETNHVRFEYGRKQRMLVSTYFITDSLEPLSSTELGKKVLEFQEKMDSIGRLGYRKKIRGKFLIEIDNNPITMGMQRDSFKSLKSIKHIDSSDGNVQVVNTESIVFRMPTKSKISLSFKNEVLVGISIGPCPETINSPKFSVMENFLQFNEALTKEYGKARKPMFRKDTYRWVFEDATIEHAIIDRFGKQEILIIKAK